MAKFTWSPSAFGGTRTLELLEPMKFREGAYIRERSRFRSIGLDRRTIATELIGDSGADLVEGRVRFVGDPALFSAMVEDGANGVRLTYEHGNGLVFTDLIVEADGRTAVRPDEGRFGLNEWEATLLLRHVGELENELFAEGVNESPENFSSGWSLSSVTVTDDDARAPDGSLADRLTVSGNDIDAQVRVDPAFTETPALVVIAVWLKDVNVGDDETALAIADQGGTQGEHRITCELLSGATSVDTGSVTTHGSHIGGDGWRRFWIVKDISAFTGDPRMKIYVNRQATNVGDAILAWGAQAERLPAGWTTSDAVPPYVQENGRVLWQLFLEAS